MNHILPNIKNEWRRNMKLFIFLEAEKMVTQNFRPNRYRTLGKITLNIVYEQQR